MSNRRTQILVAVLVAGFAPVARPAPAPPASTRPTTQLSTHPSDAEARREMAVCAGEVIRLITQREDIGNERLTPEWNCLKYDWSRRSALAAAAVAPTEAARATAMEIHLQLMRRSERQMEQRCRGCGDPILQAVLLSAVRYAVADAESLAGTEPGAGGAGEAGGGDRLYRGSAEGVYNDLAKIDRGGTTLPAPESLALRLEWSRRWAEGPAAGAAARAHAERMRAMAAEVSRLRKHPPGGVRSTVEYALAQADWWSARSSPGSHPDDRRRLARTVADAARWLYQSLEQSRDVGDRRMTGEAVSLQCDASAAWAEAVAEADDAPDGTRAAREAHLARMRALDVVMMDRFLSGVDSTAIPARIVKYHVAKAEWELVQPHKPE